MEENSIFVRQMNRAGTISVHLAGVLLVLSLLVACHGAKQSQQEELAAVLDSLDLLIDQRAHFTDLKKARLGTLRSQLAEVEEGPLEQRYRTTLELAQEYRPFRFDSALYFSKQALELGHQLPGAAAARAAAVEIAYCYLSAGLFLEAHETISSIETDDISDEEATAVHLLRMKYFLDLAEYNDHNDDMAHRYREEGIREADLALSLSPEGSHDHYFAQIHKLLHLRRYREALSTIEEILDKPSITDHDRAILLSLKGSAATELDDERMAMEALARSSGYDLITGTHETTSLARLAGLLYRMGEIDRAAGYIDLAMQDANYYDAKHRKMAVGDIRPLIEQSKLRHLDLRRRQMTIYTVVASLLCLLLIAAILVIILQMRHLRRATAQIQEANDALRLSNERLEEANAIKDEYIGSSFYRQGAYIHEQEELYRFILKRLESKQYDAIRKRIRQSEVVRERKDMYADFDETFTQLFPTFVAEYNALFPPEEQQTLLPGDPLTPEMRIFALIRVGITKTEQVAHFLNYSVNTINTYKTRVKNKSLVENKDFEGEIMKIGRSR